MNKELWERLPEPLDKYSVSSLGRIYSHRTNGYIKTYSPDGKHRQVTLRKDDGRTTTIKVHNEVARYFLGPRPEGHFVRFIDDDQTNPAVTNLEYVPASEVQPRTRAAFQRPGLGLDPISIKDTKKIREMKEYGYTNARIAKTFHITPARVYEICRGA